MVTFNGIGGLFISEEDHEPGSLQSIKRSNFSTDFTCLIKVLSFFRPGGTMG